MMLKAPVTYRIGIIGCGKMGKDLFDFLNGFSFHLTIVCKSEESVEQMKKVFEKKQKQALKYKLIDKDTFDFRNQNTIITSDLYQLSSCHLIIESITEDLHLKRELFKQVEIVVTKNCIIASNTSSIAPDQLFKKALHKERCVGLHFFFPVAVKDLAEINVSEKTDEKTVLSVKEFLNEIGKFHLVLYGKDHFLINRIFLKMQAGCCQIIKEGKCQVHELDELVTSGLFPIGVFEFFDHVGNDVMLQSVKNYIKYENDPLFFQPMMDLLESKVDDGKLGIKKASGFFEYPRKKSISDHEINEKMDHVLQQIAHWYLDGVYDTVRNSICTDDEMDHIVKAYMMVEKNPFELAKEVGYTPK
jgi:3-hydroxybutyryl-CoA dehydrogenase